MYVPSLRLDGEIAVVTGAASGVGRAIAIGLSGLGASVGCLDLLESDLDGVAKEISGNGGTATSVPTDVTEKQSLSNAVARVQEHFGDITLGVNAAGIANASPAEEMPLDQWRKLIDVDLTGVFLSCQAEANAMLRSGKGAIVNIASMSATIANRGCCRRTTMPQRPGLSKWGGVWLGNGHRATSASTVSVLATHRRL